MLQIYSEEMAHKNLQLLFSLLFTTLYLGKTPFNISYPQTQLLLFLLSVIMRIWIPSRAKNSNQQLNQT